MNFRIVLTCLLAALVSGMFIGCEYNVPITDRRVIPVDEGLLGVWQSLPGKQKAMAGKEKILILKVHETEYLIQYEPSKGDPMYFRGYPVKLGSHNAVQLQYIGTKNGPAAAHERKYNLISYKKSGKIIDVRVLNTTLISKDITKMEVLKKRVMAHKARRDLFINPAKFGKIK